jgi:hypothetical protein
MLNRKEIPGLIVRIVGMPATLKMTDAQVRLAAARPLAQDVGSDVGLFE